MIDIPFVKRPDPVSIILRQQSFPTYSSASDANYQVNIKHRYIHGHLAKDKKQPASLIIFDVQLTRGHGKARFRRFKMDVDFQMPQGADVEKCSHRPTILASAPFSVQANINETNIDVKDKMTHGNKSSLNVKVTPVIQFSAEVSNGTETQRTFQQHFYEKGTSFKRCEPGSSNWTGVWWNVEESGNPEAKDDAGISPNHRFAVLVERASNTKYVAVIQLTVDGGLGYKREKFLHTLHVGGLQSEGSVKNSGQSDSRAVMSSWWEKISWTRPQHHEELVLEFEPETYIQNTHLANHLGKWNDVKELDKLMI
jgi:hypothetical protein